MPKPRNETPHHIIYGQLTTDDGRRVWHPMFNYDNEIKAKLAFASLFTLDTFPKGSGTEDYDDFRLVPPKGRLPVSDPPRQRPPERPRKARRGRDGRNPREGASDAPAAPYRVPHRDDVKEIPPKHQRKAPAT